VAKILWLASYPKSGNTWLRVFLANYGEAGPLPVNINRLPEVSFSDARARYYAQAAGPAAGTLAEADINRLRPAVHRLLAMARPGLVPVKTHAAIAVVDGVPTISAEVTHAAIYIVRNPLDVACSFAHHYGLTVANAVRAISFAGLKTLPRADEVAQLLSDWSSHARSWLTAAGLTLHVVRYEDMIAQPHATFGDIVTFLGWPKDRARLQRALRKSDFRILAEQERTGGFVEAPRRGGRFFRSGRVGGWREELTEEDARFIVDRHREMMRRFRYLGEDDKILV
jgi:hypothetical protein